MKKKLNRIEQVSFLFFVTIFGCFFGVDGVFVNVVIITFSQWSSSTDGIQVSWCIIFGVVCLSMAPRLLCVSTLRQDHEGLAK